MKDKDIFNVEEINIPKLFEKVNENGEVFIYENNEPKYIVKPIQNENTNIVLTEMELVEVVAKRILKEHKKAFEELGKWLNSTKKKYCYCKNWL